MNKLLIKSILLITFCFSITSINAQWRYSNAKNLKGDCVITYKVEYENELSEKQKNSSRFKKKIVVIFNKDKLIEKAIRNTNGYETFTLLDYQKEKVYSCYKSLVKKEAIERKFKAPKIKPVKVFNKSVKMLGFDSKVYTRTLGNDEKEIITTKKFGLRYVKLFDVEGFLLKYSTKDKYLGPYTVTATDIIYTKLPEKTYSLENYIIRTSTERKEYLAKKKSRKVKVDEKNHYKLNKKAPKYAVKSISGKKINSKKLIGKVVVFSFWLTNGEASRKQIQQLNKLKLSYKTKDVEFIAVSPDKEHKLNKFLKLYPFYYDMIEDGKWLASKFDVKIYPTNIIIDKKGKFQYYKTSYSNDMAEAMSYKIDQLLKEK